MKLIHGFALLSCAVSLVVTKSFGQDDKLKWGRISEEELSMTQYVPDPEADAVVLADYGTVAYDFRSEDRPLRLERYVRIKFLTQAGIDAHGDVEISYYSHNRSEVMTGLKGQVFLPDGREVDVEKENMFSVEENDRWTKETISFPALEPGAIAEYKYNINSNQFFTPVDWYFQQDIPVAHSDLLVTMPEWFDYVVLQQGRPPDVNTLNKTKAPGVSDVKFYTAHYAAIDVPGLKAERHITTMDDYYAHIRYQLRTVIYPNKPSKKIMDSWDKVESELLDDTGFGREYNAKRNQEAVLEFAGMSNGETGTQLEIARKLYSALSVGLRWNQRHGVVFRKSISDVLKRKEGTSGELNLTLLSGLLAMGIDAVPVLTSTRKNGRIVELYPFLDQFNHTLVLAVLDGMPTFMDIAEGYQPVGLPRAEALNYKGWMLSEGKSNWIDINPEVSNSTYFFKLKCSPAGSLEGTLQGKFTGYLGVNERNRYYKEPDEYFKSSITSDSHTWEIVEVEVPQEDDRNVPWNMSCNVTGQENIEAGDFIYLSPMLPEDIVENPFKAESREFPVEFNYPYAQKFIIDIELPEGFVAESLPASRKMVSEFGGITFTYRTSDANGRIQLILDINVTKVKYAHDEYPMLKQIFNEISSAAGEQVVLKRAT